MNQTHTLSIHPCNLVYNLALTDITKMNKLDEEIILYDPNTSSRTIELTT